MPEYIPAVAALPSQNTQISGPLSSSGLVAPISSLSPASQRSPVNHAIRSVILCKDGDGKVGLRVKSIDKGVFVALVTKGSPAAMGGLRFGDQILQINGENVVGLNDKSVQEIIESGGAVVTVTVIPSMLFKHMVKNMSQSIVKKMMDHSIPDM